LSKSLEKNRAVKFSGYFGLQNMRAKSAVELLKISCQRTKGLSSQIESMTRLPQMLKQIRNTAFNCHVEFCRNPVPNGPGLLARLPDAGLPLGIREVPAWPGFSLASGLAAGRVI
jgi:hypothetical protein